MPSGDVRAGTAHSKPALARAALWALLGGLSFVPGWAVLSGLQESGRDVWIIHCGLGCGASVGGLLFGLAYTSVLGLAVYLAGGAGRRRAAVFSVLAMSWFPVGWTAGTALYFWVFHDASFAFLFAASLAAGLWLALAGMASLPFLRSWAAVRWLAAGGAVAGGVYAGLGMGETPYEIAAWCAVYAACFSMAVPQGRRGPEASAG